MPFALGKRCYHVVNIVFNIAESLQLVLGLQRRADGACFALKQRFSRRFSGRKSRVQRWEDILDLVTDLLLNKY